VDDLKAAERGVLLIRKAGKGSASRPLGRLICHPSSSDDSAAWLTHKESGRPLTRARTISIDLEGSIVYTEAKRAAEQAEHAIVLHVTEVKIHIHSFICKAFAQPSHSELGRGRLERDALQGSGVS